MTESVSKGKKFAGEKFSTIMTTEDVVNVRVENAKYNTDPNAVPIENWFAARGHRSEVMQSAMRAYTTVRTATMEAFDLIFEKF